MLGSNRKVSVGVRERWGERRPNWVSTVEVEGSDRGRTVIIRQDEGKQENGSGSAGQGNEPTHWGTHHTLSEWHSRCAKKLEMRAVAEELCSNGKASKRGCKALKIRVKCLLGNIICCRLSRNWQRVNADQIILCSYWLPCFQQHWVSSAIVLFTNPA